MLGAGVAKCINCLEKAMEGELVRSAAAAPVFVTDSAHRACPALNALEVQVAPWQRE